MRLCVQIGCKLEMLPVPGHFGGHHRRRRLRLRRIGRHGHAEDAFRHPEVAHAVEIAAGLADADMGQTVGHARGAKLARGAVEHIGSFPVPGGNQERFAQTEQ
ncbi:hypothetical protein SDC9_115962 [bioreactor metagenome]|uniref:Uncharacterized protein n=1 Tax=bioreactor metagenome TaxID=1076179 RepID=A0A645BV99_9ZZZZ